jgi:uncharacterized protein (UPF0147 family)
MIKNQALSKKNLNFLNYFLKFSQKRNQNYKIMDKIKNDEIISKNIKSLVTQLQGKYVTKPFIH